jgi:glycerol-3-phosphate dehydrogenase
LAEIHEARGPFTATGLPALDGAALNVLVVGGGITGACTALEAARRGLAVGLVERDDYGAGATASCLKIVHGGLRYFQQLDLRRVRQSVIERSVWLRSAPHLVEPLPVVLATYRGRFPSRSPLALALAMNEVFSADRNQGLAKERIIPRARVLSRSEATALEPTLAANDLTGGVLFHDALMYSPERLTLEVVEAARCAGAVVANHVEFLEPLLQGGRVVGARLLDTLTGATSQIRAPWIVNATGSAVPGVAQRLLRRPMAPAPEYSIALNFVTRQPARQVAFSATAMSSGNPRQLFVVPWRGQTMIGTAHLPYRGDPSNVEPSADDVETFIQEVRTARPPLDLGPDDVALVHAGLLPLHNGRRRERLPLLKHHCIVDHAADGCAGAVSVVTVKFTTARRVAVEVLDAIAPETTPRRSSRPVLLPLPGGSFESPDRLFTEARKRYGDELPADILEHLVRTYGARYDAVIDGYRHLPAWDQRVVPEAPVIRAQLAHGAAAEQGRTTDDLLWRRTELGPRGLASEVAHRSAREILARLGRAGGGTRVRV